MKNIGLVTIILTLYLTGCTVKTKQEEKHTVNTSIQGTWKLISAQTIVNNDTTLTDYTLDMDGIKIIGSDHFAFFQHDLNKGLDSANARYSSGGGKYRLAGNRYTEYLEYCSARKWEGNKFSFEVEVRNDSLIQRGVEKIAELGVNRYLTEIYTRINDTNSPVPVSNEFEVDAEQWLLSSGDGNISGVAKFKSKKGAIHFGNSFNIELMPSTPYTEERLTKIYGNQNSGSIYMADGVPRFIPDPHAYHMTRKTTCDAQGAFEFKDLAKGSYYIVAFMIWEEETEGAMVKKGGGIMQRIELKEGEKTHIKMNNF